MRPREMRRWRGISSSGLTPRRGSRRNECKPIRAPAFTGQVETNRYSESAVFGEVVLDNMLVFLGNIQDIAIDDRGIHAISKEDFECPDKLSMPLLGRNK